VIISDNAKEKDLREYFKRCFFAVDGLWFVVMEKESGFEKALEFDRKVWEVMPKIQARKIRELLGLKNDTTEHLCKALEFKFQAEDYEYQIVNLTDGTLEIEVTGCPWLKIMTGSGRQDLAAEVGKVICPVEYGAWAKEFKIGFEDGMRSLLCSDDGSCALHFTA